MSASEDVFFVPEMSNDLRLRVFRRNFNMMEEFEGMEVDAYVVTTDRYVVVFDTLLCPEDAEAMMQMVHDERAGRQVLVVNSHADWDHAWGNAYFTSVEHTAQQTIPIIAHEQGPIRMQSAEACKELADYQQAYPIFHNVVLTPANITFDANFTIYGGDLTMKLISAPGHSADHIAAWIPQLSLLLAFDAVEQPLPCLENAASVEPMFATLERFLALQPQRVLCSHGKTTSPDLITENLAYLRNIQRRCRELLLTHRPTDAELEHASALIAYPFDEVVSGKAEPVDAVFYSWAHENNVRYMLQWLMNSFFHET